MKTIINQIIFWLFIVIGFVLGYTWVAWTFIALYTAMMAFAHFGIILALTLSDEKLKEVNITDEKLNIQKSFKEPGEILGLLSFLIGVGLIYSAGWTFFASVMVINWLVLLGGSLYATKRFKKLGFK